MSDLGRKVNLDLSNLFINTKFNIISENNDFGFNSIQKINFSKKFPFKCKQTCLTGQCVIILTTN